MRIPAALPLVIVSATLLGQPAFSGQTATAPVPAAQPNHKWILHPRSGWATAQAPQLSLLAGRRLTMPPAQTFLDLPPAACPVDMHVRRLTSERSLLRTREARQPDTVIAHLQMSLRVPNSDADPDQPAPPMAQATVLVHGTNGREHIMGLDASHSASAITRTVTVSLESGDAAELIADLHLRGFTSTAWVQLKEVRWADKRVWSFPNSSCRVQPDPLMRIAEP